MRFIKFVSYTIPLSGNKRHLPYGRMVVELNGVRKTVRFGEIDGLGRSYVIFNRRRYYFNNKGDLYNPIIVFTDKESA